MDALLRSLDAFVAEQDYFWFLAAVSWLALIAFAATWRRRARSPIPGWLVTCAAAAAVYAAASVYLMVARRNIYATARWQDDVLLAVPLALGVGALAWAAWRVVGRWVAAVVLTGAVAGRAFAPELTAPLITLVAAFAGWRLLARQRETSTAVPSLHRIAIALLVALPLISPTGPVAQLIGETQRWNRLPRLGLPCAMVCFAAALLWLWISLRPATRSWGWGADDETERRDLRRFGLAFAAWLIIGFILTGLSGRWARTTFEQGLLAQARIGATLIDTRRLAECLSSELRLAPATVVTDPAGTVERYTTGAHLTKARLAPLRASLSVIRRAVDQSLWAHVMTHREGWLVSPVFDERVPVYSGEIPLHRPLTDRDRDAWALREAYVTGPINQWGIHMSARAPLFDEHRQMLGWLAIDVPIDLWIVAQTQARAQSLALTGAGVALGLLIFGLRLRNRERQAAQQATAEALRAEQRQTIFLAKVSHELRTPIQNILGYADLVHPMPGDHLSRERLDAVRTQGSLLIRLVNDLIDLSAAKAGEFRLQPRACPLFARISAAVEALRPRAEAKGLALHVEFSRPDVGLVECDPDRLHQIVTNLVGNAVKFTPSGWVRVSVRQIPFDGGASRCEVIVADSGPGIETERQNLLFRPFERLDARGEGSGLGLALARRICEAMDGTLTLESDGRTGSTFRATFAVTPAASTVQPADPGIAVSLPTTLPLRILIADDNALVRRLFRAWLEPLAAIVTEAADGAEAHRCILADPPDVLLVDISMPPPDGLELTRLLRATGFLSHRLWIVGVSAHASEAERSAALAAGMNLLLEKPIDAPALLTALAGRQPSAPALRPSPLPPSLTAALAAEFRSLAPGFSADLRMAMLARDWVRVTRLAHELGNCAFALQARELSEASALLETAARLSAPPASAVAERVFAAIGRLAPLSAPIPGAEPTTQPSPDIHELVPILRSRHPPSSGRN